VILRAPWLRTALAFALVVVAWEALELAVGARFPVVPAPSAIAGAALGASNAIWLNLRLTLLESLVGLVVGSVLGLALAALFVAWPRAEGALYNLVITVHSVPLVAVAPILLIWFGVGITAPTIVAALACFFPMVVNATRGLRAASAGALDLMRALDADPRRAFLRVRLPASLPYVMTALKLGAPAAVLGATVGEWLGTAGIGYLLFSSMVNFQVALLWATMLIAAAVALLGYLVFAGLERTLVGWHARSGGTA
jgi:NitT/TauT family transport system permease protein